MKMKAFVGVSTDLGDLQVPFVLTVNFVIIGSDTT